MVGEASSSKMTRDGAILFGAGPKGSSAYWSFYYIASSVVEWDAPANPRAGQVAEAGRYWLLRVPCSANEQSRAHGLPLPHHQPLAAHPQKAQPKGRDDLGADHEANGRLAPETADPPPLASPTLRRQAPEVGAGCPNRARPDLCGGRSVMSVPTAIGADCGSGGRARIHSFSK